MEYDRTIDVIAEELSHIWQMHKKGLTIKNSVVIYNDKRYTNYDDKWVTNFETEDLRLLFRS